MLGASLTDGERAMRNRTISRARGSSAWILFSATCVRAGSWPSSASAKKPGCHPERDGIYKTDRPRWPEDSRLRVVDERVELRCEQGASEEEFVCAWYGIHVYARGDPRSPAPETMTTLELPAGAENVEVRINGRRVVDDGDGRHVSIRDTGVAPELLVEIRAVVRWRSVAAVRGCGYGTRPAQRRHILLSRRAPPFVSRILDPGRRSRGVEEDMSEELTVVVEAPTGRVELEPLTFHPRLYVHRRPRRAAGEVRASYDVDTSVEIRVVRGPNAPGGVFLGVGGALLDVEHGLRGRIGAELAAPSKGRNLLFHSLAVETDFRASFTIVPAIELMRENFLLTRWYRAYWIVPSFGVGTGVPLQVQVGEDVRPGLRALASASWPLIGLVATFDWYPAFEPRQQDLMQLGLLAELRF